MWLDIRFLDPDFPFQFDAGDLACGLESLMMYWEAGTASLSQGNQRVVRELLWKIHDEQRDT